jgi:hypothetical protein
VLNGILGRKAKARPTQCGMLRTSSILEYLTIDVPTSTLPRGLRALQSSLRSWLGIWRFLRKLKIYVFLRNIMGLFGRHQN